MTTPSIKTRLRTWRHLLPGPQFIFYSLIGVSGVVLDYASYVVMVHYWGWNYLTSNILSTSIGITNNFLWNSFLNFKVRDRLIRRFLTFYGVGTIGLAISMLLLWLQVEFLNIPELVAKLSTIGLVVVLQYNLNKRLTFRRHS